MKIIIFSSFFYPHVGGTENYVLNLASRLAKNHKIKIITCNTEKCASEEDFFGFQVHRLDTWNFFSKRWPLPKATIRNFVIIRSALDASPDAVITNIRFYPLTLFGTFFARILRARHIHIEHSAQTPAPKNPIIRIIAKAYDRTLGKLALIFADEIAGSSQAALNFARELGVKVKKGYVAYNGINPSEFESSQRSYKKILFVGRLIYPKGCHDLINAFKIISREFLDAELLIAGDGPERPYLEDLSTNFNIKFLGLLGRAELAKVYEQCGIFVLPSYSESAPTTLLEAGAAGLVIIASDIPGIFEIFSNTKYLFKPGDINSLVGILREVLANPEEVPIEGFCLTVREHFDWDNLATKFEERLKN